MAINRISLKNFKCFQETDIEFGKITLLTGANSSGKSSLIHAILAILQTEGFPFYLSPNGKYVNMGDFEEMVFGHEKEHTIEFFISFEDRKIPFEVESKWNQGNQEVLPDLVYSKIEVPFFRLEVKRKEDEYKLNYQHDLDRRIAFEGSRASDMPDDPDFNMRGSYIRKYHGSSETISEFPFSDLKYLTDRFSLDHYMPSKTLNEYVRAHKSIDKQTNYISPFRLPPERTYYQTSDITQKIGSNGQGYIDQIVEWEDNKAPELQELTETLSALKLLREIKTQRLKGGRFELRVQVSSNKLWASLADVGFGISQFLPIIVADLQLKDDSTLILAQPEIHLHPNVQATLGDYFVKQATQKNKRYLVETHSEYLLNRIRLAIVKKEIKAEEVAIYYFENTPQGSETHRLTFTEDGQIQHAPKGFFDTYMIDTMEIALHA